jgi:hypothetical protein
MPEEKGLGSKLLGLFVEKADATPDEGTPAVSKPDSEKSAAELVAELAQETAPKKAGGHPPPHAAPATAAQARPPSPARPAMPAPSGPVTPASVDFDGVFKTAGLDTAELDRVRKAEELLKSLPEATPQDIKRQIVEASLKAFGFDVQKIVGAAQNQLKALDTYVRVNETQTAKAITDAQAQIAQLEDKVISLRADITKKTDSLASTSAAADVRKSQVHLVLDFFGAPTNAPKS